MAFYGVVNDAEDMQQIREHALPIMEIYKKHDLPVLNADNMLLALRSILFMENVSFNAAVQQTGRDDDGGVLNEDIVKFWRLHVYAWCCEQVLRLPGDLVECGVHMGLYARTMMQALDFVASEKEMVLYDTFEGLPDELSTANERLVVGGVYEIADWEQRVRESFRPWPNARIVRGRVSDVLADTAPQTVSFLHLDMNAARPEVEAFSFFRDRLVPGAMVLLDDYGRFENTEIGRSHQQVLRALG